MITQSVNMSAEPEQHLPVCEDVRQLTGDFILNFLGLKGENGTTRTVLSDLLSPLFMDPQTEVQF